tara:strand:- start:100 stop:471 length:372 start_codon:yes stop_codon:yes gene_type:complete
MNDDHLGSKKAVAMTAMMDRKKKLQEFIEQVIDQIKIKWKAFMTIVLTSPFLDEFSLATSGAMIFVASMAWRDFLQNMLDSVLSIVKVESKLFTTLLNAIIFTCLAAFIVVMIHPDDKKKKKK